MAPKRARKQILDEQGKQTKRATNQRQRARLVFRGGPSKGEVPEIVGGTPPPVAPGRRRAFGIRALER